LLTSTVSPIGFEPFAAAVYTYNGPIPLLREFIARIDPPAVRARVATRYGLYDLAAEILQSARDRAGMETLREEVIALGHTQHLVKIDAILANGGIKWKPPSRFFH